MQKGIRENQIIICPPNAADLRPIENYWSILKQEIYKDGRQFTSKATLWEAVEAASRIVPASVIARLTSSMDSRLLEVNKQDGGPIKN